MRCVGRPDIKKGADNDIWGWGGGRVNIVVRHPHMVTAAAWQNCVTQFT